MIAMPAFTNYSFRSFTIHRTLIEMIYPALRRTTQTSPGTQPVTPRLAPRPHLNEHSDWTAYWGLAIRSPAPLKRLHVD